MRTISGQEGRQGQIYPLTVNNLKTGQNRLDNCFQTLDNRQHSTMILTNRKTKKISLTIAPAFYFQTFFRPQMTEGQPRQSPVPS